MTKPVSPKSDSSSDENPSSPKDSPMQTSTHESSRPSQSPAGDGRALRILAKSVYRELRSSGHSRSDIVGFTNALLELVTTDIKDESKS